MLQFCHAVLPIPLCAAGARVPGLAAGVALMPSGNAAAQSCSQFCHADLPIPLCAAGARVPGLAAGVALVPSGNAAVPTATAAGDGLTSSLERLAVTVDKEGGLSTDGAAGACVGSVSRFG
eukprot:1130077-Pelagomonas_calceolata.AAC.3